MIRIDHIAMISLAALVTGCLAGCGAATREGGEPRNNQDPVANAGEDQTGVSTTQQLVLDGSRSSDPENQEITWAWTIESAPAGSNAPLLNAASERPTLVPDLEGTYFLSLTVSDGYRTSAPDVVQVLVDNSAPLSKAGDDRQFRTNCGGVELDGTSSVDPNGDAIQYDWSFVTKPAGSNAQIADPTAGVTYFIPDVPGLYTVELVVNDGKIAAPPDAFSVQVSGDVPRSGSVLVVNNTNGTGNYDVLEFAPNGGYLGKFVDGANVPASAWRNLYGITELANGTVLVSAAVSQRVFKFSSAGGYLGEWSTAYTQGNLSVPQGMIEVPGGDVLVVSWRTFGVGRHAVQRLNSGGTYQGDFKTNPTINAPRNVILACNGEYLVTNSENDSVDRYDGQSYDYLGALVSGVNSPTGIAQLRDGTILVSRFQNNDVQKYSPSGVALGGFAGGSQGLSAPSGIWTLGNGNVVVTSTGNDRVKLFDPDGNLLGDLGSGAPLSDPIGVVQLR